MVCCDEWCVELSHVSHFEGPSQHLAPAVNAVYVWCLPNRVGVTGSTPRARRNPTSDSTLRDDGSISPAAGGPALDPPRLSLRPDQGPYPALDSPLDSRRPGCSAGSV